MNTEIKTFKADHGFTELRDIKLYANTLKRGFTYYYDGKYDEMNPTKLITFNKTGRSLNGKFKGWWPRPSSFDGRVHKILWPACNSAKPVVFFVDNTLEYA